MNNKIKQTRIPIELQQLEKNKAQHGITCAPSTPDDYSQLLAHIPGPQNSPYEHATFQIAQLLLANPNPDDPLQAEAADLYKTNRVEFNAAARAYVRKHCGLAEAPAKDEVDKTPTVSANNSDKTENTIAKRMKLSC